MKRILIVAILLAMTATISMGCAVSNERESKLTVAVAIVPQAKFVKIVAGGLVDVVTMIPPGNSPANYQPTALQMKRLSDAEAYFSLKMPTEESNILPRLGELNPQMLIIDVREEVEKLYPPVFSSHSHDDGEAHEGVDPHIWLSPKRAQVMVQNIADVLSELDEANREVYHKNAADYIAELTALDEEIAGALAGIEQKSFIIYHSAYAYFADDYGLEMVAIEENGKQASAVDLQRVIDFARETGIKTVFYQQEFDANQAKTVAEEIGGVVAEVAPLSEDYAGALRDVVAALLEADELR